jgi:hypothetical protein
MIISITEISQYDECLFGVSMLNAVKLDVITLSAAAPFSWRWLLREICLDGILSFFSKKE